MKTTMQRWRWVLGLLATMWLSPAVGWAQQGRLGAGTITAASTVVNTYTALTADVTAGTTVLTVASNTLTGGAFTSALSTGDLVMIIQMQGATITTANDVTYGALTAYNSVGLYELAEVRSVSGSTSITLGCALTNSYFYGTAATSNVRAQVVRVPRYTTLTLSAGTASTPVSIVPGAWDGATGGVVAVDVLGSITLNSYTRIDASGKGFRGGVTGAAGAAFAALGTSNPTTLTYVTTDATYAAEKGEGIAGYEASYTTGRYGRGAPANGGGGGNNHNAAGGGGANVSTLAWANGQGNPASGYTTAWNLETSTNNADYAGTTFSAVTSGGGGRGGYTYSGSALDPATNAPGATAWGGDNRHILGGLGGRPLSTTGSSSNTTTIGNRVFLGGGGGAGHANDGTGTSGGTGGGLVYLLVGGNIGLGASATNTALAADGTSVLRLDGINTTTANDGAGGGGAGGTIILNVKGTVAAQAVSAAGGAGGSQNYSSTEAEGPGGGGGGGFVRYTSAPSGPISVAAGVSGITNSTGPNNGGTTAFPPNGATAGSAGVVPMAFTYAQQCLVTADVQTLGSGPSTGTVGQAIIYTLQTTNLSTTGVSATGVVPTFTLPTGATNVVLPTGATLVGNVVTFATVATLAAGQSVYNTVRYTPTAAGTVTASAANTSGQPDPTLANNDGSATTATVTTVISAAAFCANPGNDAPTAAVSSTRTTTLSANPVAYYPGTASVAATTSSATLTVGAALTSAGGGAQTPIASGDLLLIIQMQGADFNTTDSDSYGDGVAGGSANGITGANYSAGQYEYAVATAGTSVTAANGGTITIAGGLKNAYANQAGSTTAYQRRFQVVRVPQLGNVLLSTDIAVASWNGTAGGVFALDVAGKLDFNGKKINADGAGFRGGAAISAGFGAGTAAFNHEYAKVSTVTAQKGEGLAGTPAFVNVGGTATATGVDYNGGDAGRGAPGNAGGAGTRGTDTSGHENGGGAGGANGGTSGRGGNTYSANEPYGGEPGLAPSALSVNRLVLGGGGGAGDENDNVGTSGAAGGGLVLVRAGSISGTGTVSANGTTAANSANDAAGGGGAGGSVLLSVERGTLSTVAVTAKGGNGGSALDAAPHGTGGGGGGGVVYASATLASSDVSGGTSGYTGATTNPINAYGATSGAGGVGPTGSTGSTATTTFSAPTYGTVGAACNDAPVAANDLATTKPGTAVTLGTTTGTTAVAGNDTDATGGIDAASINLDPNSTTAVKTITVKNVGTFVADAATGAVTFTPVAGFVGVAEIPYLINDAYGLTSNQAVIRVTVENPRYDLSTTITSTPATGGSVGAGTLVPYSVVATNNTTGTTAASTVQTVQLQAGLAAAQLTISGATTNTASSVITYSSSNALYNGATYNQTTGLFSFPAISLANGSPQTYSFSAAAPGSGPYATVATIGNGNPDTTPANNTASTTLSVTPSYDIGTTITAVLPTNASGTTFGPTAGDAISFVATATDAGTTPAAGVVHTVNIGAGLTQVHVTGNGYYNAAATATTVYFANGVFTATQPASGTYLTYSVPGGYVYFPPVDLAVGQTVSNTVTFATHASGTLAPVSSFTSASLTNDTNSANNSATASTLTVVAATASTSNSTNLHTTLTATSGGSSVAPGTVAAGASIAYVATLVNDGPVDATNTVEVLSLPAGLTATTLTITGSTSNTSAVNAANQTVITYAGGANAGTAYNTSTGVLTFPSAGTLASQGTKTYNFSLLAPATSATVQVVALATTSTPEASLDDNNAHTMTTVKSVDVAIALTGPATVVAGQSLTFTATVSNVGAYAAAQVAPTVALPAGLAVSTSGTSLQLNGAAPTSVNATTGVATFANGATYTPGTGSLVLPTTTSLASGASVPYTITYLATGSASTTNVASVRTGSLDANAANNTSSVTTTKTAAADVVVSLSGPATASVGGTLTYTAATTNNGPSVATGATVPTLQLPVGLLVNTVHPSLRVNGQLPSSVTTTNGVTTATYPDNSTYNQSTGVVAFPSITDQLPGAAAGVSNTVTFDAPSTSNINVAAVATPATAANDLNQDNNSAAISTPVTAAASAADLAVTVTATSGGTATSTATAGQMVLLTVNSQNLSTSANVATTVRTQVAIAPGLPTAGVNAVQVNGAAPTSVDATTGIATYADGSTYDPATGRVVFLPAIPALGIGESRNFTVQLPAPTTGTLVAVASVRSENADPNTADNVQRLALPITTSADLTATVTGPASTTVGAAVAYTVTTTNLTPTTAGNFGGSPAVGATQTISIPANAATGTPVVTGPGATGATITGTAATGYSIVLPLGTLGVGLANAAVNTVSFTVGTSATTPFVVTGAASTTGTGATTDPVTANNSGTATQQQSTTITTTGPLAADIVNNGRTGTNAGQSPLGNTAGQVAITSLAATATGAGNSITSYTITSLPAVGTLYVGGTAITSLPTGGLSVTLANALLLSYDPAATGTQGTTTPSTLDASNQFFTFSATDNNGAVSNVARYIVPVNQDAPVVYTVNTPKAATVVYNNGDEIARAFDYNGGKATTTAIFTPDPTTATSATSNGNSTNMPTNGLASAVVNLVTNTTTNTTTTLAAAGLQLNATTGRISVLDKTLLKAGTYKLNLTTVDNYGGVTTQDVTFNIGTAGTGPLPVTLTTFTAQAVRNQDGLLKWITASETDNDYFDVERSLDGVSFVKIGTATGQGTKLTPTDYTLTDAHVAAKATGLVYYRLRQVDLSGAATYSAVRAISFSEGTATLAGLYPNPAASATALDLRSLPAANTYQVLLLDATGRATRTWALGGGQLQALELSNVAAGTYHVLVTGLQPNGSVLRQALRLTKE